jgi:hypothetical protein
MDPLSIMAKPTGITRTEAGIFFVREMLNMEGKNREAAPIF